MSRSSGARVHRGWPAVRFGHPMRPFPHHHPAPPKGARGLTTWAPRGLCMRHAADTSGRGCRHHARRPGAGTPRRQSRARRDASRGLRKLALSGPRRLDKDRSMRRLQSACDPAGTARGAAAIRAAFGRRHDPAHGEDLSARSNPPGQGMGMGWWTGQGSAGGERVAPGQEGRAWSAANPLPKSLRGTV